MTYKTLQNIVTTFDLSDIPVKKIKTWLNHNAVHSNKHGNNYKNFSLQDTIACTLITKNNDIVGLSTIMERDHWPDNTFRVLSRYFIHPRYRAGYQKYLPMNKRTISMLEQQILFLKRRQATACFFTLHLYKPRWTRDLCLYLNDVTSHKWNYIDVMRVGRGNKRNSYQHVIYTGNKPQFKETKYELLQTT